MHIYIYIHTYIHTYIHICIERGRERERERKRTTNMIISLLYVYVYIYIYIYIHIRQFLQQAASVPTGQMGRAVLLKLSDRMLLWWKACARFGDVQTLDNSGFYGQICSELQRCSGLIGWHPRCSELNVCLRCHSVHADIALRFRTIVQLNSSRTTILRVRFPGQLPVHSRMSPL